MAAGRPTFSSPADPVTPIPWWLWPNVLALDAPAVGVVWQRFLGSAVDVPIPLVASVILALIVWGVYLTDRWLDADPRRVPEPGDRHRFARQFRTRLGLTNGLVWAFVCGVALVWLPGRYVTAGAGVAIVVAGYFAVVHLARRGRFISCGGKEAAVGLLFAAGVSVPLMADAGAAWKIWAGSVVAFAMLCWLNCELIARWEARHVTSPMRTIVILAITICGLAGTCPFVVGLAVLVSLAVLIFLHTLRERLGPRLTRVLADVALFTPLAGYWI